MATQSVPTFQQLSSLTAVANLRPRSSARRRRPLTPPILRPRRKHEPKALQDREKLLVDMLPLVKRVALRIRKRLPAHVELDDLFSDGVLGLVDAVAKFDASKRVKLKTYAQHRIRGSILDGLRAADPASRDLRHRNQRIQKIQHELEVKLGRPVTDEEMAAVQGMTLARWHRELNEIQSGGLESGARTLSAAPTHVQTSIEPEFLAGDDPDPFDLCFRHERSEILFRAISGLGERERTIIGLYYQCGLTMQEIASRMKVDASRVSQLHAAALVRLEAGVASLLHPTHAGSAKSGTRSMAPGAGAQSDSSVRLNGMARYWVEQPSKRPGHLAKEKASRLPNFFHRSTFVRTKSRMPRHVFAGVLELDSH